MTFIHGISKVAGALDGVARVAKRALVGGTQVAKGLGKGLSQAGAGTVGDALKLKGLSGLGTAAAGVGTGAGRKAFGQALGKAAPSIAAGAAYGYGAKKVYDKTLGAPNANEGYYQ
jgi:hypothetical protein